MPGLVVFGLCTGACRRAGRTVRLSSLDQTNLQEATVNNASQMRANMQHIRNVPNTITRHFPISTSSAAMPPSATQGVPMPCTNSTRSPSSGPHSKTWMTPYGVGTSLLPGSASGGYGSASASVAESSGKRVLKGPSSHGCFVWILWRCLEVSNVAKAATPASATSPFCSWPRLLVAIITDLCSGPYRRGMELPRGEHFASAI